MALILLRKVIFQSRAHQPYVGGINQDLASIHGMSQFENRVSTVASKLFNNFSIFCVHLRSLRRKMIIIMVYLDRFPFIFSIFLILSSTRSPISWSRSSCARMGYSSLRL